MTKKVYYEEVLLHGISGHILEVSLIEMPESKKFGIEFVIEREVVAVLCKNKKRAYQLFRLLQRCSDE